MKKVLLLLFVYCSISSAQSPDVLIKQVQDHFSKINNFSADFARSAKSAQQSTTPKVEGKFFYQKNNKYRIEIKDQILVSDGKSNWNYNKKQKRLIISSVEDETSAYLFEKYIYDYPKVCSLQLLESNDSYSVIQLIPKEDDLPFKSANISINKKNIITELEIVDAFDMTYRFEFTNISFNNKIARNKFEFEAPQGTKIIDYRE